MQISKFRSFQITTALDSSLTRVHIIFFFCISLTLSLRQDHKLVTRYTQLP